MVNSGNEGMSEAHSDKIPVSIHLHQKSRLLAIEFSDGRRFELPCEYLRVYSKAKEVRTLGQPVTGKEDVNIERIEPQGQYAVRLVFDDGHDTGIYAWDTLYDLGLHREKYWAEYLERLQQTGYQRTEAAAGATRRVKLLYFSYLVKKMGRDGEEVVLPPTVADVTGLIGWLRRRDAERAWLFADGSLRVTVNKQFAEPFTRLEDGDEVALVPSSPNPPPKP
jgi:DUF971 family protein/molybdopterin converting factor small subunit